MCWIGGIWYLSCSEMLALHVNRKSAWSMSHMIHTYTTTIWTRIASLWTHKLGELGSVMLKGNLRGASQEPTTSLVWYGPIRQVSISTQDSQNSIRRLAYFQNNSTGPQQYDTYSNFPQFSGNLLCMRGTVRWWCKNPTVTRVHREWDPAGCGLISHFFHFIFLTFFQRQKQEYISYLETLLFSSARPLGRHNVRIFVLVLFKSQKISRWKWSPHHQPVMVDMRSWAAVTSIHEDSANWSSRSNCEQVRQFWSIYDIALHDGRLCSSGMKLPKDELRQVNIELTSTRPRVILSSADLECLHFPSCSMISMPMIMGDCNLFPTFQMCSRLYVVQWYKIFLQKMWWGPDSELYALSVASGSLTETKLKLHYPKLDSHVTACKTVSPRRETRLVIFPDEICTRSPRYGPTLLKGDRLVCATLCIHPF